MFLVGLLNGSGRYRLRSLGWVQWGVRKTVAPFKTTWFGIDRFKTVPTTTIHTELSSITGFMSQDVT